MGIYMWYMCVYASHLANGVPVTGRYCVACPPPLDLDSFPARDVGG